MRKLLPFVFLLFIGGCVTTALYGEKLEPIGNDTYTLEIAFGGLPITPEKEIELTTRGVLAEEAKKFMSQSSAFSSYEIVKYERNLIPSVIVYTVKFNANKPFKQDF